MAYKRWSRIERVTCSWSEMTDEQLTDEAFRIIVEGMGRNDEFVCKTFAYYGMRDESRADKAITEARKLLKINGWNPAQLTRSVGSDDYVDGRTQRSTI